MDFREREYEVVDWVRFRHGTAQWRAFVKAFDKSRGILDHLSDITVEEIGVLICPANVTHNFNIKPVVHSVDYILTC
jgi:hypothetical protein